MGFEVKMRGIILGLDIGIGSVGWALIDMDRHVILAMGVHLFDPPQENKTKVSLAATRRMARSQRRNTKRSVDRGTHCLRLLKAAGLVPQEAGKEWLQLAKGDTQIIDARVEGLDRLLSDREFAQVLYSLCKRRGYIPHGDKESDADGRKVLSAIQANTQMMEERGWRTVGEFLKESGSTRNKGGKYDKCVTNAQIIDEVEKLFEAQRGFGNPKATESAEHWYIDCVTWQKDTSGRDERTYSQVARCELFPEEKRAPKACLSFELCVAYERLCHTVIVMPDGSEKKLPASYKKNAIGVLFSTTPIKGNKECKVRYSDVRKALDLPAAASFKGVDPAKERDTELARPVAWRLLRKQLPAELMTRLWEDRALADAVGFALTYASSERSLLEKLEPLGLNDVEMAAIASLPYSGRAFSGYGNRSLKALELLIDSFEDVEHVTTLAEAMDASGLELLRREDRARFDKLPPYKTYDTTCSNPVVLRVMGRVRKVVNAIIDQYGMPDEVHIELARELKHGAREKDAIAKSNAKRHDEKEACKAQIAEDLGCTPDEVSGTLVRKLELWKEQEGIDVYSGKPISYERLLGDSAYCDIDHVLPYSRTCDDSTTNKVLTTADNNRSKGCRSPYEWLYEQGSWDEYRQRVLESQRIPYKKRLKLLEEGLAEKEPAFIERNLNDTRHATRAAYGYLADCLQYPENGRKRHVYAVAGGATSALRGAWGFAKKDRQADDAHHAVDAAIVAACSSSTVIKVAKASEAKLLTPKAQREGLFRDTAPWDGFSEAVEELAERIVPTRMVDHGGTARLFEDFRYRFDGIRADGKKALLTRSGKTTPSGNYVILEDGSAALPDGMAYLRLWWDDESCHYLPEPVYYADLADMKKGTYCPKVFTRDKPRPLWNPLPESAKGHCVEVRYGAPIKVCGVTARYLRFNSSSGGWILKDIQHFSSEPLAGMTIASIRSKDDLEVIHEDILGMCYLL